MKAPNRPLLAVTVQEAGRRGPHGPADVSPQLRTHRVGPRTKARRQRVTPAAPHRPARSSRARDRAARRSRRPGVEVGRHLRMVVDGRASLRRRRLRVVPDRQPGWPHRRRRIRRVQRVRPGDRPTRPTAPAEAVRGRAAVVARCRGTGRGWPADLLGRALSLLYDDSAYSCTDTPGSKIQDRTLAAQARARRKPDAPSGAMSRRARPLPCPHVGKLSPLGHTAPPRMPTSPPSPPPSTKPEFPRRLRHRRRRPPASATTARFPTPPKSSSG